MLSYFALAATGDMPLAGMNADLLLLGALTVLLSTIVFSRRYVALNLTPRAANSLLSCATALLALASPYLWWATGGEFTQLLDARFQVPGFGALSSLYMVATLVGSCVFVRARGWLLKTVFVATVLYVGIVVGGKALLGPVLFGISLALSLRITAFSRWSIVLLVGSVAASVVLSVALKYDDLDDALAALMLRVLLAADSVQWLSQMRPQDIFQFPVSELSFLLDIPLRLVGIRLNTRSVGSEIAYLVNGDESGGGPNANLPTMAFLLSSGNLLRAALFVLLIFVGAYVFLRAVRSGSRHRRRATAVLFSSAVFLSPTIVIDLVVYFQYLFWLALIGLMATSRTRIRWNRAPRRVASRRTLSVPTIAPGPIMPEPAPLPRVLVLMATFNGRQWLAAQVDSVLAQQDVEVSLLIGDDASTDGTFECLTSEYGLHRAVTLKRAKASSGSAGANFRRLIEQADTTEIDYVAFADQDDIWHPRKLVSATKAMGKHAADAYSAAAEATWPDGRRRVLVQSNRIRRADFLFEGAGQGCTFVMTASVFNRLKAFCDVHAAAVSAMHYHDWLTYLLVRSWSLNWYFDSRVFINYRQHAGNEIGARGGASAASRRLARIRDGWYSGQIQLCGRLYELAGGDDPKIQRIVDVLAQPTKNLQRRSCVAWLALRHGRRRLSDRLVLAFAAAWGWL